MLCSLFLKPAMFSPFQVQAPDLSASAPAVGGEGIGVEGAMPSVDVGLPSASASLDAPGEKRLLPKRPQIVRIRRSPLRDTSIDHTWYIFEGRRGSLM